MKQDIKYYQYYQKKRPAVLVVLTISIGLFVCWAGLKYAQAQTTITNQAQAVYQDSSGSNYGPVYSSEITITVTGGIFTVHYSREGVSSFTGAVAVRFYSVSTGQLTASVNVIMNSAGTGSGDVPSSVEPGQRYHLVLKAPYCLTRKLSSVLWSNSAVLTFPQVLAGNLNNTDDIINTLDWSIMNTNWRSSNQTADINKDGIVNTIDWGIMNKNWRLTGEENS